MFTALMFLYDFMLLFGVLAIPSIGNMTVTSGNNTRSMTEEEKSMFETFGLGFFFLFLFILVLYAIGVWIYFYFLAVVIRSYRLLNRESNNQTYPREIAMKPWGNA
jgi:hypothetical protein